MNFTLEESNTEKVPLLLEELLKNILSRTQSIDSLQKDILFIVIIVLMVENGFVPVNDELQPIDTMSIDTEQFLRWKLTSGVFETKFIMVGFQNPYLKLIMSPLGSTVIVNIMVNDINRETYSFCVPVSRYIVSPQASTIPMIFRDLKHLSINFKNKTISAVKSFILSCHGYPSASLMGLPQEVFFKIIMYLPIVDVISISKTCDRLHSLMANECVWHDLYRRDFNVNETVTENWKTLYKATYLEKKDANLRQSRSVEHIGGSLHDFMDYADYISYIDNPMWII